MITTKDYKGYIIEIYQDDDISESINDFCDDDLFLTGHNRRHFWVEQPGFMFTDGIPSAIRKAWHVFPLFAYIHGGVALSLSNDGYPFNDRWDAGQVGHVFAKRSEFRGKKSLEAAQSLVNVCNDVLLGNIFGYTITDENGEVIGACGGFYGAFDSDNGALSEARAVVDAKKGGK